MTNGGKIESRAWPAPRLPTRLPRVFPQRWPAFAQRQQKLLLLTLLLHEQTRASA